MSRTAIITEEDIKKAKKLRDEATSVTEYRKALSVILMAELQLDADTLSELLGTTEALYFATKMQFAIKMPPENPGVGVAGSL